jgi:SAM-dependent methyltransferase
MEKIDVDELMKEKCPTPARYQKNKLIKKIFKKYYILRDKYFIDVGTGGGEILTFLDYWGMKGEGIDLSKNACEIAKKRVSKNIEVKQEDFMKLQNGKYGLLMMIDVLEHIRDDDSFIKKANNLLEDNGYYLINVPAKMKLFGDKDIYAGHYKRYEKRRLIDLLEKNGFQIIKFWSYGSALLGKIYSFLLKGEVRDNKEKNTLESGIKTPDFMRWVYFIAGRFYWITSFQNFFLNTNLGSQYLVLCRKIKKLNNGNDIPPEPGGK